MGYITDWLVLGPVTFLDYVTEWREKREYEEKGFLASHGSIPRSTYEVNGMIPQVGGERLKDVESFSLYDNEGKEVWFSYEDEGIEQAWEFLEAAAKRRGDELIRPAPLKVKSLDEALRETFPRLFSWAGPAKKEMDAQ